MPIEFLRGVLGVMCLFFAHLAGRTWVATRAGRLKLSRFHGWLFRALLCGIAVIFRHAVDFVAVLIWALAVLAFVAGLWAASRPPKEEDLTHEIFPGQ